ncbi:MAG: glycosyltransferase family 39 protein, partial [Oscillospiraceae bacterium]
MGLSILISILFLTGIYIYQKECGDKLSIDINAKREDSNFKYSLAILIVVALGVRLVIAYFTAGHPTDMNCWNAWGGKVSSEGLTNFYGPFVKDATTLSGLSSEYFCDYPPGYMYVLGAISHFINFFKLPETVVPLMYKLPGILCDMGLLIFFYKLAEKNMGKSVALWIGCIVAFIPIFVFNSAVWGQIESVLVLLLIASLYLLYKKKYMLSALLFVVSVLVKPQGLLVAPIYLFAFLETKDWKMIGKVMLASFALGFLLIIPFSPAWTTVDGNFFVKLLNSFNPLWLVEKYSATLGSYKFFTVNAFNFYGLLGFNWKPLDIQGMETFISILNWGIIALAIAISGFMYYKIKTPSGKIFMPAFMIIAFLFTFGFKMHERYMMPALAFLLCEYVFTRNKKLLWLCGGFSITTFLNAVYVLYTTVTLDNAMPLYSVVGVISMFEVALFILSVWVIIKDYMLPKKIEKKIAINKTNTESSEETQNSKKPKKALKKMVRADYLALAIITLAYSAIAFTNLGDTTAPQTFYKPLAENESFILELEDPANVSKITSYLGIGNVEGDAKLDMVASLDG